MSGQAGEREKANGAAHETNRKDFTYEYSGIRERAGSVNAWLILLYAALTIWGIWYLFAYWTKS